MFQQIQGTPYSNYQVDNAEDWATVQSICGVSFPTDVPTPISNLTSIPGYAPTDVVYSNNCLSGNTYTAVSGDTMQAISQNNGVATGTLIAINNLLPDGSDLQAGQVLCLPYVCQLYTIVSNDTCDSIANTVNIPFPAFLGYNPTINPYCTNLITGNSVCVTPPGGVYNATTISGAIPTQTAVYATATVAPPGPTAHGTTANCGKYYQVQPGDFCQVVAINQTIALPLFEAINPSIDLACDNLTPGLWYCVSPLQYWDQTGTPTTPSEVAAPTTTPEGSTDVCYQWYVVQPNDFCALIESSFGITFTQFQIWNPDLQSNCSNLLAGEAYCVDSPITTSLLPQSAAPTAAASSSGSQPSTTAGSSTSSGTPSSSSSSATFVPAPTTTAAGTTSSCYMWYIVNSGDTCNAIDTTYSITLSQFLIWNTGVNADCTNIQVGLAYCVSSPVQQSSATSTTSTNTASSTTVAAPTTTVSGTTSDCFEWYVIQSGDTCDAIDSTFGCSLAQFLTWNQGVNSACTNIEVGIAYCVNSPITAGSKVKREVIGVQKRSEKGSGVRGWPIVNVVRNVGLPPKFPGLSPAYDNVALGAL
jgi:LysM repeat protein